MTTSVNTTVSLDNLLAKSTVPVIRTGETLAISQTITMGSALGKKLVAAGAVANGGAGGGGANTGDGTCTAFALTNSGVIPKIGTYALKFTAAVTHGGEYIVKDPFGMTVAYGAMTAGAGAATIIEVEGFVFTLTDGSTDFAVGDGFTLTIAAGTGQVVKLDKSLTDGSQFIYGIALEAVTTGSGATGSVPVGITGVYNSDVVNFVSGTTVADVVEDARKKGIFFVDATF